MQPRPDRARVVGREAGGQQGPAEPAEHVAGAGDGQPGGADGGDPDPPVGLGDEGVVALEQDRRLPLARGAAGERELVGLHLGTVDPEHRRELARVGGQEGRPVEPGREVGERIGVDDERYVVLQRLGQRLGRLGVAAGADHPGLHASVADDDLGVRRAYGVGCTTGVPDHAGEPARRTRGREHARAGVTGRAGADADDAAGVLLSVDRRRREKGSHVVGLQRADRGGGQVEADVDQLDHSARRGRRLDEVADLVGPEGDGDVRGHVVALEPAGVDVEAAGGVDRDERHALDPREGLGRGRPQPGVAPDADDPVDDHVGTTHVSEVDQAAAGAPESRGSCLVHLVGDRHRLHVRAPARQHRPGEQGVPAVVAGPDQHQHPRSVRRTEQVAHRGRESRRGPLHERAVGHGRHQRSLRGPHLLDGVRGPHAPTLAAPRARAGSRTGVRTPTSAPPAPRPRRRCRRRGRARGGRGPPRWPPPRRRPCHAG